MTTRPVPPPNPYGVLVLSLLLPGTGHVLQGLPQRGLIFLFFIVLLGWVTLQLSSPAHSFLGRYAGGFFVYGICALDAYKVARVRFEQWRQTAHP